MDISIMVNGVRIDLTPEQVAKLTEKAEEKKNPFEWDENKAFYYITSEFELIQASGGIFSNFYKPYYESGNYCADKKIMRQHALHMKLNQLLWRYSMMHGGDKIDWKDITSDKYYIEIFEEIFEFHNSEGQPHIQCNSDIMSRTAGVVYFADEETANKAIEEVVKPFMEANQDFDWSRM